MSPKVLMIAETTKPQIIHSTNPRNAAFSFCPLTIITVFIDWIDISTILAAKTKMHTIIGFNEANNSDIFEPLIH